MRSPVPPLLRFGIMKVPPAGKGIRAAHVWSERGGEGTYLARQPSGLVLRCDLRDELSKVVYFRGFVDEAVPAWLSSWLRPDDLVVDVGAHIGYVASLAAAAGARVVAYEPNPRSFGKLAAAVADSPASVQARIRLRPVAVGSEPGSLTLYEPAGDLAEQSSRATLVASDMFQASATVPVVRLDDELSGPIRLLKIDVEGFERDALAGASRLISEAEAEAILIELNPGALAAAGSSTEEIVGVLLEAGYVPHEVTDEGRLRRLALPIEVSTEYQDVAFLAARAVASSP